MANNNLLGNVGIINSNQKQNAIQKINPILDANGNVVTPIPTPQNQYPMYDPSGILLGYSSIPNGNQGQLLGGLGTAPIHGGLGRPMGAVRARRHMPIGYIQ